MSATVVLGKQGRLVIPAEVRTALSLSPGDQLDIYISGRTLVIEASRDSVAELRQLAAKIPKSRSLVEELLAERLLEAQSE